MKEELVVALKEFINQKPNFSFSDYVCMKDYKTDYRQSLKGRHKALALLEQFKLMPFSQKVFEDCLKQNDRIVLKRENGRLKFGYIVGQYFSVEYGWAIANLLECYLSKIKG